MNNDLISREALKKAFEDTVCIEPMPYAFVKQIIDNAPTVEPEVYITAKDYNLYMEGYKQGRKDFERPQGEWIDYSNEGYVECPFCGSATNCEDNKDELHYCWNCGANMQK